MRESLLYSANGCGDGERGSAHACGPPGTGALLRRYRALKMGHIKREALGPTSKVVVGFQLHHMRPSAAELHVPEGAAMLAHR